MINPKSERSIKSPNTQKGSDHWDDRKDMNLQDVSKNINKEFKERKIKDAAAASGGKYDILISQKLQSIQTCIYD